MMLQFFLGWVSGLLSTGCAIAFYCALSMLLVPKDVLPQKIYMYYKKTYLIQTQGDCLDPQSSCV